MFKLPIRIWILNAAAVFSGSHGAVTAQAEGSSCSRETVYQHARKVEQRLDDRANDDAVAQLRAENQRLQEVIAKQQSAAERRVNLDKDKQRQFAITALAMSVSLRQAEDLLGRAPAPESGSRPFDPRPLGCQRG